MKVPYSWLQSFFDRQLPDVQRLVELLDGLGLAVEDVAEAPAAPRDVVVVDVIKVEPVPGATSVLSQTIVSDGTREHLVVCGDPNIRPGMRTALALPGAYLPAVDLQVKARELVGVQSNGMLASAKELGLYEHGAGVIALGRDAALGAELASLWPSESVIEVELTPNRADAFSILGVARDVGAKLGYSYRHPASGLPAGDPDLDDGLTLDVQDLGAAPRFTLRRVDGVAVAPSPVWLQRRLGQLGLRPRNNIVDATNYVTFELGQPTHAYDFGAIPQGHVIVRWAHAGERLKVLNDETIEMTASDLVIATTANGVDVPLGLAGVMGGANGGVTSATTAVALETACFEHVTVRRSGQRHKLVTDARTRFERGVDPNLQELASARLTALVVEVAGGSPHAGLTAVGKSSVRQPVDYRPTRVHYLMDFDVPRSVQRGYLGALGCKVVERELDDWRVTPPSWRYDINIEEDVIEEVARLHGYEHIGLTDPDMRFVPPESDPTHRKLRERLAALGLQEAMTYVFAGATELARAGAPAPVVELSAPQGVEKGVLRTAIYPGLLAAAAANRQAEALAFFEIGHVFGQEEEERVALLLRGQRELGKWRPGLPGDFFTLKGILESLAGLEGAKLQTLPARQPYLHPGVSAKVVWNGEDVGFAGQLHPEVAAAFGLPDTFVAELNLPLGGTRIAFKDIVRQPYAERDLAIVAPIAITFADLAGLLSAAAGEKLFTLSPFDEYRGDKLPAGTRSLALRFRFRDANRALTDEAVDELMENVIRAVRGAGYDIRT